MGSSSRFWDAFTRRFSLNNMLDDCYTAAIVEHYSRNELLPDKTHDPTPPKNVRFLNVSPQSTLEKKMFIATSRN